MNESQRKYIEEVGMFLENQGMTRMAGRILGWLLIAEPPHQSQQDLVDVLQASKGSISTNTRMLLHSGMIKRVSLPGDRKTYFAIPDGLWIDIMRASLAEVTHMKNLATHGLQIMADRPEQSKRRLQEMFDLVNFLEQEFPAIVDRWEQQQKNKS
jgi:DNA-binding transcriptional regulator GbsR (MarR family)